MEKQTLIVASSNTRRLVICALLVALGVVLGGLLSIPLMPLGAYTLKIGLGVLPVILSGVMYGPVYGGMVGGLTDFLQAMIFPKGAYIPWFTLVGICFGLIPGLFFMKKQNPGFLRLFFAIAVSQLICSVGMNTALLVYLYGSPWQIVYARLVNQAVMIPLYTILIFAILCLLKKGNVIE